MYSYYRQIVCIVQTIPRMLLRFALFALQITRDKLFYVCWKSTHEFHNFSTECKISLHFAVYLEYSIVIAS